MTAPVMGGIAWWADAWLAPAGIASAEQFSEPIIGDPTPTLSPTGIPPGAVGTPMVSYEQFVDALSAASDEAFGEPIVLLGNAQGARTTSITSQAAVGTPTLIRSRIITGAGGIPSAEAVGTPTIPSRPKFDTYAAAVGAYGGNPVVTINATEGAYAIADFGSNQAITIHAATYAGIPMNKVLDHGSPAMARFELADVPGGPQYVGVSWSGGIANLSALVVRTYIDVQSAAHPAKETAFATGISDAETAGAAELVANAIGVSGPYLVGFSGGTQRGFAGAGGDGINAADSASSETFTGGASGANAWVSFNTILSSLAMRIDIPSIPSAEAFGTAAVSFDQNVTPTGIASDEIVETPVLKRTMTPAGIASGEAFGNATLATSSVTLTAVGITSGEAFGNTIVSQGQLFVIPTGIASAETFGTAVIGYGAVTVSPTAIDSAETFGAAVVGPGTIALAPSSIASAEAFGTASVGSVFTPFDEENTNRTGQPVPVGAVSLRVTLIGAGSVGATGGFGTGGAGGGGGGRVVTETFPVSSLGSTYSTTRGMGGAGNGAASTFSSGSVSLSAGGGTGSAGGTCSASGVTATTYNGSAGGAPTISTGNPGANNTDNAGAGGGAGGSFNFGSHNGGAGGNSTTRTGGTANSGTPTAAASGDGGAGGGGGFDGQAGGAGGVYGGGGGGGGGNAGGAAGGHGYTLIEWTLDQFVAPSGIPSGAAFGTATIGRGAISVAPTGIASAEAFGTAIVGNRQFVEPSSITSAEAFGTATVSDASAVDLEFVGAASNAGTSVSIPTHQIGDLIVISACDRGSTNTPTKPTAGGTVPAWVDLDNNAGADFIASRTAYFVATATNTTSGTWTGADNVTVVVLRNQNTTDPIGGHAESGSNGTTSSASIAPAVTLENTTGSSILIHFHHHRFSNAVAAAPAGYTRRATGGNYGLVNTKDDTTTDGSVSQTMYSGSAGYRASTIEILD